LNPYALGVQRLYELLLGLEAGFLSREGLMSIDWRPRWPLQEVFGAAAWNLVLVAAAVAVVVWAYRRDGRTRAWRLTLGGLRLAFLVLIITLLNRPTLSLERLRVEPGVVAILLDRSASMQVEDVGEDRSERFTSALEAATSVAEQTSETHDVRRFLIDTGATEVESLDNDPTSDATDLQTATADALRQLRGTNLAAVVLLSDGRNTDTTTAAVTPDVPVYTIPVGDPAEPANVAIEAVLAEPNVFAGDTLNVITRIRTDGVEGPVTVRLQRSDGTAALDAAGNPLTATVVEDAEVELQLPTTTPGPLDLQIVAEAPPGVRETSLDDNTRPLRVDVLEATLRVLYVDGYPRWEYRYLKNQIIRDDTIDASILLTSADADFPQEGNSPIRRFPVSEEEFASYDVVLLGDVSPRQFSDGQLELIREFVGDKGGGFGMIAGPRNSPWSWTGTAIEALLPVDVVAEPSQSVAATNGWRPVVTPAGSRTGIFRFFADKEANERYLEEGLRPLYWFATGVRPKAGLGDVLARHPDEEGPDGEAAALLVAGRYGAGRTLFNAIDESWRWRYYTGEPVFDTFWVQQLRYLARGRKLGDRRATLDVDRPGYLIGERATVELRILDGRLANNLPDRLEARLLDADATPVDTVSLVRRSTNAGGEASRYTGSFDADRAGAFTAVVAPLAGDVPELADPFVVDLPRGELLRPATDFPALQRLATETGGRVIPLNDLTQLDIPTAARRTPVLTDRALWDAPIALGLLALLLTLEWTGRKVAGLV
jgi:uncharacterized membrane protein